MIDDPHGTIDRVVHVIAPLPFGGLESVVQALASASHRAGRRVVVAMLLQDNHTHPLVDRLRQEGVEVAEVRCGRRRYWAEVGAVARIIREARAQVVHSHNYHADIVALVAARRCGVPIVTTVHGYSGGDMKNRAYEWFDRWLMRFFSRVICVSNETRQRVIKAGCPAERVEVIQNGYAAPPPYLRSKARALLGLSERDRVVGWVGRLSHEKGPDLLVRAVARLGTTNACCLVVGDGAERVPMLRQSAALGIPSERLRLVGPRDDVAQLFPAFDVFVISSRTEGTPMALLEAMAASVPVVAFGVGGIPNVLDEQSGWLVAPGDPDSLANAISESLAHPSEAAARAARARKVLEARFGLQPWLAKIEGAYGLARSMYLQASGALSAGGDQKIV